MKVGFITGMPASGKSLIMTWIGLLEKVYGHRKIYTNYNVKFQDGTANLADIIELRYAIQQEFETDIPVKNTRIPLDHTPKTFLWDEVHGMWDSYRTFTEEALDMGYLSDQHRKINANIFYNSQHPERIHKSLRGITNMIIYCEAIGDWDNPIGFRVIFDYKFSDGQPIEIILPKYKLEPLFSYYDTLKRIAPTVTKRDK